MGKFRRRGMSVAWILFLGLLQAAPALADSGPKRAKAWFSMDASPDVPVWKAAAIESAVRTYLSGFKRIDLTEEDQNPSSKCGQGQLSCLLTAADSRGIDILMVGHLDTSGVRFESYDPKTASLVAQTSLAFGDGARLEVFRQRAFQAVSRFVQRGGILDQESGPADPVSSPKDPFLAWLYETGVPPGFLFFFAGCLWALAIMKFSDTAFPGLQGLEDVGSYNVLTAADSWIGLTLLKLSLLSAVILPLAWAARLMVSHFHWGNLTAWALTAPAVLLLSLGIARHGFKKIWPAAARLLNCRGIGGDLERRRIPYATAALATFSLGVFAAAVTSSLRYHPIYEARMKLLKDKIQKQEHLLRTGNHGAN